MATITISASLPVGSGLAEFRDTKEMMPIVDPYVQLSDDEFQLVDYLDSISAFHVLRLVAVQQPQSAEQALKEMQYLHALSNTRGYGGFPNGIIAYCDLTQPSAVSQLLDHELSVDIRGVHFAPNYFISREVAPAPTEESNESSFLLDHVEHVEHAVQKEHKRLFSWLQELEHLQSQDMSLDLTVDAEQCDLIDTIATQYPDLTLIVNIQNWSAWMDFNGSVQLPGCIGMLAKHENIQLKICGCLHNDSGNSTEALSQFIELSVSRFGYERVMFSTGPGHNGVAAPFDELWGSYVATTSTFSARHREKLFRSNAVRVYKL